MFANAHLFRVDDPMNEFHLRIAAGCGAGLTTDDTKHLPKFFERLAALNECANECNTSMLIDAEQTYMQAAIDSLAMQYCRQYNVGNKQIVLNTF